MCCPTEMGWGGEVATLGLESECCFNPASRKIVDSPKFSKWNTKPADRVRSEPAIFEAEHLGRLELRYLQHVLPQGV